MTRPVSFISPYFLRVPSRPRRSRTAASVMPSALKANGGSRLTYGSLERRHAEEAGIAYFELKLAKLITGPHLTGCGGARAANDVADQMSEPVSHPIAVLAHR